MQDSESSSTDVDQVSFASILSSLTPVPHQAGVERDPWNDEKLEDDVVRLSDNQALRSPAARESTGLEARSDKPAGHPHHAKNTSESEGGSGEVSPGFVQTQLRKTSSVTIRLSKSDCERLRLRAAEAGLTVSAYLRSCAFEVESLRTQVKQALAQIRQPVSDSESQNASLARHDKWRLRLFSHWNRRNRA